VKGVALAVFAGCCVIAAALYFALRRPAPVTPSPAPAGSAVQPHDESVRKVVAFLDGQRQRFRSECWDPIVAKQPEPATSIYVFDVTVGADGHEVLRSINEQHGRSRSDVAQCLRAIQDAPIAIAPPGESVHATWTLSFP
jgi:hypothetical protein